MTMEELLAHVKGSSTDLIRIIEAAGREDLPCVVVTSRAVEAWERRALDRGERGAYVTRRC